MSKYTISDTRLLGAETRLTEHAALRYQQRTPYSVNLSPRAAWERGEWLRHPELVKGPNSDPPDSARIYRDSSGWGVAFLIEQKLDTIEGGPPLAAVTVVSIEQYDHSPTVAYLSAHGPHDND